MGLNNFKTLFKSGFIQYLISVISIGITALACIPLAKTQGYHVVSFLLLFVVSLLSIFLTVGPIVLASTVAAIIWNFFFIPPHLTFHIDKTEDILIFGLFFIIALINGVMHSRIRNQEKITREREQRTHALFQLTKELSVASGINEVIKIAGHHTFNYFHFTPVFLIQNENNALELISDLRHEDALTDVELEIAKNVHNTSVISITEIKSKSLPRKCIIQPMIGSKINPGVVIIRSDEIYDNLPSNLWDAFLTQISNALEREFLAEMAQKVRFLDESDRLYKTLFNSISHEFRIPVATIMGAADSLLNESNNPQVQNALAHEILTASLRLNRLIENLLNMSRLQSGHLSLRLDWYDLNDLFNKVSNDLKDELQPFLFEIEYSDNIPLVKIDFGLMEQVLYNILLNATQYSKPGTKIRLTAAFDEENLIISISDQGVGFHHERINHAFDTFYRANQNKTGGLGLGLSISRGFVEAHKGQIQVNNNEDGGACFVIKLPTELPSFITF
jgi:two-component system sensor histidine kinase KdpD